MGVRVDKLSFMRESINDIQLTIRAIDVKAGFFLGRVIN